MTTAALPSWRKKVHPNYSGDQPSAETVAVSGEEKSSPFVAFPLLPIRTTVACPNRWLPNYGQGWWDQGEKPALPCRCGEYLAKGIKPLPNASALRVFSRCSTSVVRSAEGSFAAPTALYQKNRVWPWLWLKARRGSNACEWSARAATGGFALRRHVREPCTGEYGEDSTALWCGISIPPKAVSR